MTVNISDRKVVDTRLPEDSVSYRLTDVPVIGIQPAAPAPFEPGVSQDPTAAPGEVGVVRLITLESQAVRIQPDGSAVVDVTLSFEPAQGATKHEVRITKL